MLSLFIHDLGDVTVFRCTGRITAEDVDRLRNAVLCRPHVQMPILDLAEINIVDAAGLGTLVALQNWANATRAKFKLLNLRPKVEELLELTHLRSTFEVCSARDMFDLLCRATHQSQFAAAAAASSRTQIAAD